MKEIFVILLSTALLVQAAARRLIPGATGKPKAWFLAGCGVLLTLTVSAVLTAALDLLALTPLGLGAARLIVMILLIALCALGLAKQDICPGLCAKDTGGVLLTAAAAGVLGLGLICSEAAAAPGAALRYSLILGGLYALLSFLLAGILNRIDEDALPAPVRGVPVLALCAALIAIALMGLNGLSF